MAKIVVNAQTCLGAGSCERLAPHFFALNDEGYATVVGHGDVDDAVRAAIDECPTMSIAQVDE